MNREIYDKVYFNDNYSQQFSELRERYHDRAQMALTPRKEDTAPVPNATTVVLMNDTPDGGVTITTADFVAFYNERHGYDRVSEVRHNIVDSAHRVEVKRMREKQEALLRKKAEQAKRREAIERRSEERKKPREVFSPRFSFVHAAFSAMLVCSLVLFFGVSAALNESRAQLVSLENELAVARAAGAESEPVAEQYDVMDLAKVTTLSEEVEEEAPVKTEEGEKQVFSTAGMMSALAGLGES